MRAIVCRKSGPPDVLQITEVAKPEPRGDEVLIRIVAGTVTYGDVALRSMRGPMRLIFSLALGLGRDKILGHELAGEIEAVGKEVTRFKVGDPVFASTGIKGGANAEYICLPADGLVAGKPANMTFEEAAAVPVGGLTALFILRKADIRAGQKVLVYGASGSVGTYAVQLATHFEAEVTGVCSTANLELVQSLGADHVIDYTQEDFTKNGETYDVIFDAVNKLSASGCKRSLGEQGSFLSARSWTDPKADDLVFLMELAEKGQLRAVIDRRYPFEQAAEAHRYVEQGHKRGNVVLQVAKGS
jgi:NADPH:quinone reductase-like Zn-dependent oxidoreductase